MQTIIRAMGETDEQFRMRSAECARERLRQQLADAQAKADLEQFMRRNVKKPKAKKEEAA